MSNPVLFYVEDGGTLSAVDFNTPKTRLDVYEHIADEWSKSPRDLFNAMNQCQPLTWEVNSIYDDHRAQLVDALETALANESLDKLKISALTKRLEQLPEDPYDGASDWLLGLTDSEFQEKIVPAVQKWFNSSPDWVNETEYFPDDSSAQDLAVQFFQSMDSDALNALGVIIAEGEHPGSTYYAAELEIDVDDANQRAVKLNIPVKFERK